MTEKVGDAAGPRIEGPVAGGRGHPFGMPDPAVLEAHGYVMSEFLASGTARRYEPAAGCAGGHDGIWTTEPGAAEPYTTRFVVIRPADPARFNGVVVVNWQNVTAGVDLGAPHGREVWRGYAWVAVSAQVGGVTGLHGQPGLRSWDPDRYATLAHPGDAWSYDIFAQVARAVGPDRGVGPLDPMDGLRVETVLAAGGSQSAARLGSYLNAVHQHDNLFDGFLLGVHWGVCIGLDEAPTQLTPDGDIVGDRRIRDDQGVPVLVVNAETEAWSIHPVRQPDTATFRFWEVTGGCHGGAGQWWDGLRSDLRRDGIDLHHLMADETGSSLDWTYVEDAALRALVHWVRDGIAPPRFAPIELEYGHPLRSVRRDADGLGRGGVRLPEIDVPLAVQSGVNEKPQHLARLAGECRPLPPDRIAQLYPGGLVDYLERYDRAADELAARGGVLAEDLGPLKARARELAAAAGLT
jgi:Alpha/beta hydrolase domain